MVLPARFWSKVDKRGPAECWLWSGGQSKGYGLFWWNGRTVSVHRLVYETFIGRLPPGHEPDHLCNHPLCLNPAHLRALPHRANCIRRFSRLRRCPAGHPYSEDNLVFYSRGEGGLNRRCRECMRSKARARRAAMQATPPKLSDTAKLKVMRATRRERRTVTARSSSPVDSAPD